MDEIYHQIPIPLCFHSCISVKECCGRTLALKYRNDATHILRPVSVLMQLKCLRCTDNDLLLLEFATLAECYLIN